ncbi:MAG: TldD/PmbA family protein [Gammaproteobacteria bacterium]|nr:TldD/PmbA family protein [Gammaproteobacteria bacterium]
MKSILDMFKSLAPKCDFWSLRIVDDVTETLNVRENIVQPPRLHRSTGLHLTMIDHGGVGYAASSELTREGLLHAIRQAQYWCQHTAGKMLFDTTVIPRPSRSGKYETPVTQAWDSVGLKDKIGWLSDINAELNIHESIVDWQAHLSHRQTHMHLITSDEVNIEQVFHYVMPGYDAVANKGAQTQIRSGGGWGSARQGGLEQLSAFDFPTGARRTAEEAIALVDAPECPAGKLSLLLMPNQMMLQIHESIGHPLELDRILGDERNYAGTSFVTREMFGQYQYGSELLNVSSNAGIAEELATIGFDDDGTPSEKHFLIQKGKLLRPLGSALSQARASLTGVANARACDWNRPAIDRMANLNVEAGDKTFAELIAGIENGVLMDTNKSWSIDDSRNKFQFGCELGRVIKDGVVGEIVRNPNYRGISANFWRNLAAVGDQSTFEVWGTPNCGKGEPNQMIHVGHASPACVFSDVEVFGGA